MRHDLRDLSSLRTRCEVSLSFGRKSYGPPTGRPLNADRVRAGYREARSLVPLEVFDAVERSNLLVYGSLLPLVLFIGVRPGTHDPEEPPSDKLTLGGPDKMSRVPGRRGVWLPAKVSEITAKALALAVHVHDAPPALAVLREAPSGDLDEFGRGSATVADLHQEGARFGTDLGEDHDSKQGGLEDVIAAFRPPVVVALSRETMENFVRHAYPDVAGLSLHPFHHAKTGEVRSKPVGLLQMGGRQVWFLASPQSPSMPDIANYEAGIAEAIAHGLVNRAAARS
ncbi:MAG: hypothetical protein LC624_02965 [Halobacteriales archaeon]|nr:hypothetical protein [Halobacteriales archaeon]